MTIINKEENKIIPLFAEGGFGEKIDRVELAEYMIQLTNTALQNLVYNANKKGVRLSIPCLSVDIKPDDLSNKEGQWTFYEVKVKWDSFDTGIIFEDD